MDLSVSLHRHHLDVSPTLLVFLEHVEHLESVFEKGLNVLLVVFDLNGP